MPPPLRRAALKIAALSKLIPWSIKIRIQALDEQRRGEPELRLLSVLCDVRYASVDVGANRGIYTYFLRKYSRKVYAIGANPAYIEIIRAAYGDSVSVIQAAASNCIETTTLWIPVDRTVEGMATVERNSPVVSSECRAIDVSCVTLDSMTLDKIGFIKIDVEGHELAVLEGATHIISRDAPVLLIEVENRHRPNAIASVQEFLDQFGYDGLFLFDRKLRPIEQFDAATYQNPENLGSRRKRDGTIPYINNFVFVSRANGSASERLAPLRAA